MPNGNKPIMDPDLLFNQAIAHHQAGSLEAAMQAYQTLLGISPDHAGGLCNLGMLLCQAGYPEFGQPLFERLVELQPDNHEYRMFLGNAHYMLGKHAEAEASYRASLTLQPDNAVSLFNLGNALKGQGKHEEAVSCYQQAIARHSAYYEAFVNMGLSLYELGRPHASISCLRQALTIQPNDPTTHHNLGLVLRSVGQLETARESYLKALELNPDYIEAHDSLLFLYNLLADISPAEMLREAKHYGELVLSQARPYQSWRVSAVHDKCLRVGFVSGDLCGHPVGFFLENFLQSLDPARLELVAYATDTHQDELTKRIKPLFKNWISAVGMSDEALAQHIHNDSIDILIDLAGHTRNNRLPVFAWKPAPVQLTWLGYLATTGVPGMDYLLADRWALPEEEEPLFTETIWRLPATYICYTPPALDIQSGRTPALQNGYITFGCFNNTAKMNDAVIALWSRILHAVPDSRLYLKAEELRESDEVQRVRVRYASHGIGAERLVLEARSPSREEHFASFQRVDIALDPFPYPGITSTMDALWMGVPVLSKKGDRFISHQGETILNNAGLSEWIAADAEDYVSKAQTFASDLQSLSELRGRLRQQILNSPLCDAKRFARNFERALSDIWKQRCATLATSHS